MKILKLSIGTCLIVLLWKMLEMLFYGEVQRRTVDDIMAVIWIVTVVVAYQSGIRSEREILKLAMNDIKHMDNCTICQHHDSDPDCDCECDKCTSETCVCVKCHNEDRWRWQHADRLNRAQGVVE